MLKGCEKIQEGRGENNKVQHISSQIQEGKGEESPEAGLHDEQKCLCSLVS